MQVHVSLSYGEEFSRVHSPSTMWVRSITTRGFDVCVRETGSARNESGVINWVAFQDHMGMIHGSLEFSGIWTTETKCNKVDFSKVSQPRFFVACCTMMMKNACIRNELCRIATHSKSFKVPGAFWAKLKGVTISNTKNGQKHLLPLKHEIEMERLI